MPTAQGNSCPGEDLHTGGIVTLLGVKSFNRGQVREAKGWREGLYQGDPRGVLTGCEPCMGLEEQVVIHRDTN